MEFNDLYSHPAQAPEYATVQKYSDPTYATSYSNSSVLVPAASPSYVANTNDATDAMDAVVAGVMPEQGRDMLSRFLGRKKSFAARSVQDILGGMYERQRLKDELNHAIDYQHSRLMTKLLETDTWITGRYPQLDKARSQLERQIQSLEQERRKEDIACWRDLIRLKSELREAMREFHDEYHKGAFLSPWKSGNSAEN